MANTLNLGGGKWARKEGSLLAYNSENNNYKPLPFTFDRASSATRVNKQGLIETVGADQPRIDYLNDSNGALLLEPSRTNLILNSQRISLSPTQNGTFTDNFAISPDGTQNATKLTATDTDPFFYQSVSFSAGSYTASIYVKGIGNSVGKDFQIRLGGSGSAQIEIPSEWTRIEYTATMTSGSANCGIEIPNPSVIGDEVLVWGWQIEAGSYATSYIPTQGSAVTRLADSCNQTPPSGIIGQTEGTVYVEGTAILDTNGSIPFTIYLNSSNILYCWFKTNGIIDVEVFANGLLQDRIRTSVGTIANGDYFKLSVGYKSNDLVAYLNGVQIGTASPSSIPSCSSLILGGYIAADYTGSLIKETKLYNTRLSNTELQALTQV